MEDQETKVLSISEILAIAKRRFLWIAVPVVFGPMIGLGITFLLKPVYTSDAFVLIQQPKVPDKYVTSVLDDQTNARLSTMRDQILSRSRLEPVIHKYGLDRGSRAGSTEVLVENLRKAIKVTPLRTEGTGPLSGFYISANADRPDVARGICTDVLSMFIVESSHIRQQQAEDTTEFLSGQLAESKKKLDQDDAALAAFKQQYMGQLPSDETRNLQMLTSIGTQLDVVSQALAQAEQQKIFQESLIAQQLTARSNTGVPASTRDEIEIELAKLQAQERDLQARYTSDHPDVMKLRSQIADLQAKLRENRKPNASGGTEIGGANSPELERMRLTLHMTEATIREKRQEQARLQQQMQSFQGKIQLSPSVEEKYKILTRDYESSLQFYKELLGKKTQSEMSTNLERQQEGEQFKVMDQPSLPAAPSWPKRTQFALAGLGAGLVLGLLLVFWQEKRQHFIRSEEDVEHFLALPILAGIPDFTQK
jgi:polysaccharide chain length determinant protein (PEP-CTERM system associated)